MEAVPQTVLNWLHSVLLGEYHDVNRTYTDVAHTLSDFKGLKPSTDAYTFENGQSSLLLHLSGTIPVTFRESLFHIPVSLWIPQTYPREMPISYVMPTSNMMVRPGQHVSGEGRIYHPYLANWRPDKSSTGELVHILQEVFGKEPPVVAKQPQVNRDSPQPWQDGGPPPRPPLPPQLASKSQDSRSLSMALGQAPLPPPKPPQETPRSATLPPNAGPPVPPHPSRDEQGNRQNNVVDNDRPPVPGYRMQSPHANQRYSQPAPLPPQEQRRFQSVYSSQEGPVSPVSSNHPSNGWSQHQGQPRQDYQPGQAQNLQQQQHYAPYPHHSQQYQQPPHNQPQQEQHQQWQPPPPKRPQPATDLLSDPFDPPLPTNTTPLPVPAVPPNPEKDALLSAISHNITSQIHSIVSSNSSAQLPLHSQYAALQSSLRSLQQESSSLSTLASDLAQNENALNVAMRDADAVIQRAQTMKVPGVDEVLVAPTVVGQQMYELVAEERACAEAREVLGRALDRGRVGAEAWVRAMRGLGREEFQKKVLVRKAAKGLGLVGTEDEAPGGGAWI